MYSRARLLNIRCLSMVSTVRLYCQDIFVEYRHFVPSFYLLSSSETDPDAFLSQQERRGLVCPWNLVHDDLLYL
jgi:hypothetical protein